jgi:superfamily II DNA or RNA helicase
VPPQLVLESPTCLRIPAAVVGSRAGKALADALGYEDKSVTHQWQQWRRVQKQDDKWLSSPSGRRRHWSVEKDGREALDARVAGLDAERRKSCLRVDGHGHWVPAGLRPLVEEILGHPEVVPLYDLPAPRGLTVVSDLPDPDRPAQTEAVEALTRVNYGPAAIEYATGWGKSRVAARLVQERGGRGAVVVVPTLSIAGQMYNLLAGMFGRRHVGKFYGGKKESVRTIVVAVAASLTRLNAAVQKDADDIVALQSKGLLVGDESHLWAAETLLRVAEGYLGSIPYRYFLSGTQIRSDGLDLVLAGVVGPIVARKSLREGVDAGVLARPIFRQWRATSVHPGTSADPLKMNRWHLYENPAVYTHAVQVVKAALAAGHRPMIMIQQVSQIQHLVQAGLPEAAGVAHSGTDKHDRKGLPERYHKSDPDQLVADFVAGKLPVLVGTSCIGIGTDIPPADVCCDLVGLASEAQVRQRVGRLARRAPGKDRFWYNDYRVCNVPVLDNQAEKRAEIYDELYGPVLYPEVR